MENQPSQRVELLSGFGWIIVGGAIVDGSWTMDRLENLGINPYTAPGLVPGILGAVIVLCGLILALRAVRAGGLFTDGAAVTREPIINGRIVLVLALYLGFALGLVGRGLPFWAAAAIFIFLHIFLFQFAERRQAGTIWRGLIVAAAIGIGASLVIATIFQEFFLVRLP